VLPVGRVDIERVNTITELIATENGLHVVDQDAEFNMNCEMTVSKGERSNLTSMYSSSMSLRRTHRREHAE
jgi:hypothetical protein